MLFRWILRWMGVRWLRRAVAGGRRPPLLDFGLGFALLRDRRVPIGRKGLAVLLGLGATALLIALQLPVEGLVALLLNVPGVALDGLVDGLEALAGPLLFGALFLTRLAPPQVTERLRAERSAPPLPRVRRPA